MVDSFDEASKQAIWHGSPSDALSDNAASNAGATEEAVDKMFSSFPPGSHAMLVGDRSGDAMRQ